VVTEEEVMRELDADKDGVISKEEFQEWWMKHREEHISKMEMLLGDTVILIFLMYPSIIRESCGLFACGAPRY
jgi:hypothetical protein